MLNTHVHTNSGQSTNLWGGVVHKCIYQYRSKPTVSLFGDNDLADSTKEAQGLKYADPTNFGKFNPLTYDDDCASTTICLVTLTV